MIQKFGNLFGHFQDIYDWISPLNKPLDQSTCIYVWFIQTQQSMGRNEYGKSGHLSTVFSLYCAQQEIYFICLENMFACQFNEEQANEQLEWLTLICNPGLPMRVMGLSHIHGSQHGSSQTIVPGSSLLSPASPWTHRADIHLKPWRTGISGEELNLHTFPSQSTWMKNNSISLLVGTVYRMCSHRIHKSGSFAPGECRS